LALSRWTRAQQSYPTLTHAPLCHVLVGYMGSVTVLEAIADVMKKMKAANNGQVTYGK